MKAKISRAKGSRPLLEELEGQILYSADALGGIDSVLVANKDDTVLEATLLENQRANSEVRASQSTTAAEHELQVRHEIVFVDTDTENYQQLVDDLSNQSNATRQIDVFILDNTRDGVAQINEVLANYTDLDAMHIIAHGGDGVLDLGSARLDSNTLNQNATHIAGWSSAFSDSGDLLIYGCDLAATADGQTLVKGLSTLTGADVAASNDLTGSAALGGDWQLEFTAGKIETGVAISEQAQKNWTGILDLTPEGDETRVNTNTTGTQTITPYGGGNVAMDSSGNYVVVFIDEDSNSGDIYFQRYNAAGVAQGANTIVNSSTANTQSEAQVSMDDSGNFVVVWQSDGQDGSGAGVYAQRFNASGVPQGSEFRVNTTTANDQSLPNVAMSATGSFVVTWSDSAADGSGSGIYAQFYSAAGVAQGSEFRVNVSTTSDQAYSSIAMDASGNVVVVWESQHGGSNDIYGQRFDSGGVALGSQFLINSTTGDSQLNASVAMADDGDFVVVWESSAQDPDGSSGIYAQRFDAAGVAQGSEFRVNSTTADAQIVPSVAMDASGRFIVSWMSDNQDGSNFGTFAQLYDANGVAQGGEVLINTTTNNNQSRPAAAFDNGRVVIAWVGEGVGDNAGVFTQRFSAGYGLSDLSSGIELNTDGGNDAYLISNTGLGQSLTATTFEIQFAANNTPNETVFLSFNNAAGDEYSIQLNDVDGSLELDFGNGTTQYSTAIDYQATLVDGQLHSLAVSWDSTNGDWVVYVDGQRIDSGTALNAGVALDTTNGQFVFGQEQDGLDSGYAADQFFSGTIFDVRIWSEVRSEAEISLNHQNRLDSGNLPSGLVANWQMDSFDGANEIVDVVSGNDLSIGHAVGAGFVSSTPTDGLQVNENSANGTRVGIVVPTSAVSHNDLVEDGQFYEGVPANSTQVFGTGSTFGDWTVASGNVESLGGWMSPGPQGGTPIELGAGSVGTISQTLATEVGSSYQITFAVTGDFTAGDAVKDLRVSADGTSVDFQVSEPDGWSASNPLFEMRTMSFVATSTSTVLSFASLDTSSASQTAVVTDVSVLEIPAAVTAILNDDPTLTYDAATDKFYRFVGSSETWTNASTLAQGAQVNGVDGQLAAIRSGYENELVRSIVANAGWGTAWLGGTDQTVEGDFRWVDGSADDDLFWTGGATALGGYSNFEPGEPNISSENFVFLYSSNGLWDDADSTSNTGYVIEWDASEVLSNYTFTLTDSANGRFAIDSDTGELTVADSTQLDYQNATSHDVLVQVRDAAGSTYSESMTIEVNYVGLQPYQSVPSAQTVDENDTLTFSIANGNAVAVSDSEPGADTPLQVFLSVNDGVLTLSQTTGLSVPGGSNGSSFMTIQGTESDINAALEGMTFTPDANFNGSVTLEMTTSLGADLDGHYTFEGGNAVDQSAGLSQDGTIVNGTTAIDGTRGEVLSLDGNRDYVEITGMFGNPTDVTLAAWVNITPSSGNNEVISLGDNLLMRVNFDGQLVVYHNDSGSTQLVTTGAIVGSGWNHVAVAFDDTNDQIRIYLNGVEVESRTETSSLSYSRGSNTFIGAHGFNETNFDFDGLIDDARIYDRALSADEISALATDNTTVSASVAITVNVVVPNQVSVAADDAVTTEQNTAVVIAPTGNDSDADTNPISLIEFTQPTNGSVSDNGNGTLTYTPDANYLGADAFEYVAIDAGTGLQHYFGLDGNAIDLVGGINGTLNGTTTVAGDFGNGLSFNEAIDYVALPGVTYNSEFSISFEFRVDEINGSLFQYLYSHGDINSTNSINIFLNEDGHGTDPNVLRTVVRDANDTLDNTALEVNVASLVGDGQFHTYTLTAGANGLEVFIDGVSVASDATRGVDGVDPTGNAILGSTHDIDGARMFGGELDSVQIFDNALDSSQVADLASNTNRGSVNVNVTQGTIAPAAVNTDEDAVFVFSGANVISVDDGIAGDTPIRVTLGVANGVLSLANLTNIGFVDGADGSSAMVIEGLESDVNAALDGLTFTPNANFNGGDTLNITTTLAANLVGNYTFETDASDQSAGTTYNGTLNGNATIVNDAERGQVLNLDGSGDFVQIDGLMGEPADLTLAGWINADSVDALGGVVISLGTSPALYLHSDGTLIGYYESGGTNNVVQSTESLVGTGWRHVAVSIDAASSMTIYVDGVAVDTMTPVGGIEYDHHPDTYIGRAGDGGTGYDFDGMIDDARIYLRALTVDEIAALATDQTETTDSVAITVDAINDSPSFLIGDGIETLHIGDAGLDNGANAVFVQPDGRILSIGDSNTGSDRDFTITRHLADGSLDTSFGGGDGIATLDFGATLEYGFDLTMQADGKILVTGRTEGATTDLVLGRLNTDGSLDSTFGGGAGYVTYEGGGSDMGFSVHALANGHIAVAGLTAGSGNDALLLQFTEAGLLDTDFGGGDGVVVADLGGDDRYTSLAVQADGRLVAVGYSDSGGVRTWHVQRYDADGTLDSDFGTAGTVTTSFAGYDEATATDVAIADDGSIVVGGYASSATDSDFALVRYTSTGALDNTFGGGDGIVTHSVSANYERVEGIALQSDGSIVVVGDSDNQTTAAIVRFTASGVLDTSFATGGEFTFAPADSAYNSYNGVSIHNDTIIVAGTTSGAESDALITRLNSDGSVDTRFGLVNTLDGNPTYVEGAAAVVIDSDVQVFDQELSAIDDFGGVTLTLGRSGGDDPEDIFSATGDVVFNGGTLELLSTDIGTYTNSGGQLVLTFDSGVTNAQVNAVMQSIAYANSSETPPASVVIIWVINDGNVGAQGADAAAALGVTTINIQSAADLSITAPATATTDEDTAFVYSGANVISIDDGIAADTRIQVSLSVANGVLSLADLTDIDFVAGANSSSAMVIEGLASDINIALDGLTFTPNPDFNGSDTLTISTAIAADLVGQYTFDGGDAADQSYGNTQDGALVGDAVIVTDPERGDVVSLDGSVDAVRIDSLFGEPASVTLSSWVNLTSGDGELISLGDNIAIRLDSSFTGSGIQAFYYDGTTYQSIASGEFIAGTGWHHIAATFDDASRTLSLYIDGALVVSQTFSESIAYEQGTSTFIGAHGNGETHHNIIGMIDDARVYDRALTADEIAALATDQVAVTTSVAITVNAVNDAPTFMTGDGIETDFSSTVADAASDLLIQGDGRLVMIGTSSGAGGTQIELTRYSEDGSLDTSFGGTGSVTTSVNTSETIAAGTLQPDGRILVAGATNAGTGESLIVRYNADGSLDATFGVGGVLTFDLGPTSSEYFQDITVTPDGKIVAVGYANTGGDEVMTIVRLNADGSLDDTFNGTGQLTLDLVAGDDRANAVTIQDDGRIVIAGQFGSSSTSDLAVIRLNLDGSLDTSFNGTGIYTLDVNGEFDAATDVVIDSEGRLVVGGTVRNGAASTESLVLRLNSNGTLDTDFNVTGIHVISAGAPHESVEAITLQDDGRIVLVGSSYTSSGINDVSVIRLDADGSLDATFAGDGTLRQPIGTATDQANAVVIDRDGNIIVTGRTDASQNGTFVMRIAPNGTIDAGSGFSLTNTLDGNPTFVEGGSAVTLDGDVDVRDSELDALNSGDGDYDGASVTLVRNTGANADDVFSFADGNGISLVGGNVLQRLGATIATFDTTTTGQLVITFTNANGQIPTSADVDAILRQITYVNSSESPPASAQIDWTLNDGNVTSQGSGGSRVAAGSTTVTIQGAADPQVVAPTTGSTDEDSTIVFSGANEIQVYDGVVSVDSPMQVTLSVANGTLTLAGTTGITFIVGADGASTMVIEGLESDLNAALDGLIFAPDADYNGADTLTVTTALAAELVGNYTFEGGTAADQSNGTSQDGTIVNGTTVVDGARGEVLSLDAQGEYVEIASEFGQPSDVTLAAWVNLSSAASEAGEVISIGNAVALRVNDTTHGVTAYFYDGSSFNFVGADLDFTDDAWHHIAFSFDDSANTQTLYIDGIAVATASSTSSIDYNTGFSNTRIGAHVNDSDTDFDFNGLIDDVRVYTRALTADEIAALATDVTEATASVAITVDAVNDAPVLTSAPGGGTYNENSFGTYFHNTLTITDIDSPSFDGGQVTVSITNNGESTDRLIVRDGGNVTVSGSDVLYDFGAGDVIVGSIAGGTGDADPLVITFNASSDAVSVEAVAQQVAFMSISDNPSELQRSLSMVVTDDQGESSATAARVMNVIAHNDAPAVDLDADDSSAAGVNFATSWLEGAGPVAVADSDATFADVDSANIASLTVTITNLLDGALEALAADTTGTSISASYDSLTGILLLSGPDTAANYQQVLRTVTYNNSSLMPDTTARTITFVASDGEDTSPVATTTLSIGAVDNPAVISGDVSYSGNEGDAVGGDMDATDPDGLTDGTIFSVTSAASNGTAAIDAATGVWTFTPSDANWFGSDSFTVTVTDDQGGTTEQVVSITLANVDDPAVISGDVSYTGDEGDAVGGDMDATDVEGLTDGTIFTVTAAATNGTAAIDAASGVWTFTPTDSNWFGTDSFTVTVTDDLGGTTEQVVSITLANVDDPAIISGDVSYTGDEGDTVGGDMDATDVDGLTDGTIFTVTAAAANGTAAIDPATGVWTFTPTDSDWFGSDSFTVTVTDDEGGTTEQVVSITLANVDDPAVISGDVSYTGSEGDTVGGDMDATDVDGLTDGTIFSVTSAAANGTAAIDPATGVWTFTPTDSDWFGTDSFTVTVTDDLGGTTEQVVNITLANVDDPAIISGDVSYTGDEGDTVGGDMDASDVDGLTDGTIFTVTAAAANGTAAIDPATGVWTFTPTDSNWFGSDSFTVTVTDDEGGTTEQVVSITLANVDDPAIISGDVSYTGDEGDTVGGDMDASDVDGLTDGTIFSVTAAAANGTAAIDPATGVWTFTPTDSNWFGSDSFTVTVTDDEGGTTEQVVSITLANVDDPAIISGDVSYTGDEGDTVGGDMDASDVDGLTDGTIFSVTAAAANGNAAIDPATGVWTFTPTDSNWFGTDSFTVTVTDDLGGTTEQVVSITLANADDSAIITGDVSYTGDEGDTVGGDMDASDVDGLTDGTIFSVTAAAANGTAAIDPATGVWTFTPTDADWFGSDSFTVTVTDDLGGTTEQIVNITLANVDDPAIISGEVSYTGDEGDTVGGDMDATDVDGLTDGTIFSVTAAAANGTAAIDPATGVWTFTPTDSNWFGSDSFTVTVTDDEGGTTEQVVSITLANVDDPAIISGDVSYTGDEGDTVGGDMDASDVDGLTDGTIFSVTAAAANGNAAIDPATGVWTFTPTDSNWFGTDSFTVTVTDDLGGTTEQVVSITLANADDSAIITGDVSYTGDEGDTVGGDMDASDVDGLTDGTIFSVTAAAANGTAAIDPATGVWTFTPTDADWFGSDSFTVTVTDDLGGTTEQIVNITLANVDDPAIISGEVSYTGDEGDTVGGDMDATDVDGLTDGTIFSVTAAAANGTAAIDPATGVWTFTPTDSNWFGSDSFTVTVTDDEGGTTEQVVSITLANVDDPAIISGDVSYTGDEGDTVGGDMDASDVDGLTDGTIFSVTAAAANGNAAIDPATGVWTFTPTDSNWFGTDNFTVTVTDDLGGTTEQVVSITLANVDDPAIISGDVSYTGDEGDMVGGDMDATDVDGLTDGTIFSVTAAAANGTAAIDPATGVWTFTPTDSDWYGTDSFTVTVTDDLGGTTEQVVSITLANVDDPAIISGDVSYTGDEGDTIGGDLDATDVDGLTDGTIFTVTATAANGTAAIDSATGVWTFTPTDADWFGTDSFTVTVTDDLGGTTEQVVSITLANVDDAAVISGDVSYIGNEGDAVGGDMDASDVDGLTDGTIFSVTAAAANGSAVIDPATGVWTFTPTDSNWFGTDSFTVTVTDDLGGTTEQIVNITLANVDDAAVISGDVNYAGDEGDTVGGDMDASDVDGLTDGTIFSVTAAASNGTATIDPATGVWTFTPTDSDWFGSDSFTVTVTDDLGGTTEQVVNIALANVDDAAIITGDVSYSGNEGDTIVGDLDAFDIDGLTDGTVFSVTTAGANGTAVIDPATGAWSFTPTDPDWFGTDSFTISVTDDLGGTSLQTVSITLANVNDPTVISGDISYTGDEGDVATGDMDAADVDGLTDGTVFTISSSATNGAVQIDPATGVWRFTAGDENWFGTDSFEVTITDDSGGTHTQLVTVSLASVDDAPVIGGVASGTVIEDNNVEDGALIVRGIATISDADMGESSFLSNSVAGTYGVLTNDATGSWVYVADNNNAAIQGLDEGETLVDTLTVTTADGTTQAVQITIVGTEDAAVVAGQSEGAVVENQVVSAQGALTISDTDLSDNPVFYDMAATTSDGGFGKFEMTGGVWTYTLDAPQETLRALYSGDAIKDSFEFIASDGSKAVVSVTIVGTSDETDLVVTGTTDIVDEKTPEEFDWLNDVVEAANTSATSEASADADNVASQEATLVAAALQDNFDDPTQFQGPDSIPQFLDIQDATGTQQGPSPTLRDRGGEPLVIVTNEVTLVQSPLFTQAVLEISELDTSLPTPLVQQLANQSALREAMQTMRDDLHEADDAERQAEHVVDISLRVSGAVLSTGSLAWLLRGASLFASALSSVPAWKGFDPLPVLTRVKREDVEDANADEAFTNKVDKGEAAADRILSDVQTNQNLEPPYAGQ